MTGISENFEGNKILCSLERPILSFRNTKSTSHVWTQMSSSISFWQPTSEMASNKKEKVPKRNTKELREIR